METQARKSIHPLMWVAGIALTVFSAVGIGAFMGWIPTSTGETPAPSVSSVAPPPAAAARRSTGAERPHRDRQRTRDHVAAPPPAPVVAAPCAECGVVQSVLEVDDKGKGSGVGAVGGAVVGGVVGNQVGRGTGKTVMTVVGAVGGALAGNEIEKRVQTTKHYDVSVRFEDGSSRIIRESNPPSWRAGDKVRVVNGILQPNG